jgi:hypothetical protein
MKTDSNGESPEDLQRKAISRWHEIFHGDLDQGRVKGRGLALRWLLLGVAGMLLLVGFAWRGERFRQLDGTRPERTDRVALALRELQVEGAQAEQLAGLIRAHQRVRDSLDLVRVSEAARLRELSLSRSELNQNQILSLALLRALDSLRFHSRQALLDSCRHHFGLWRTARLESLLP